MDTNKNPKLIKNGGKGTNVGNALRWLALTGKKVAPELLELAGEITGVQGLSKLGNAIRSDKDLKNADKELAFSFDRFGRCSLSRSFQVEQSRVEWCRIGKFYLDNL